MNITLEYSKKKLSPFSLYRPPRYNIFSNNSCYKISLIFCIECGHHYVVKTDEQL